MLPFFVFTGLLLSAAVVLAWTRGKDERRWTESFLESFGKPMDKERDLERIASYWNARKQGGEGGAQLDERTWRDLDMDEVFTFVDRTASQVGSQVLYDTLRRPNENDGGLAELDALATAFAEQPELRVGVTRELLRLRAWHVSYLPDLLWRDLPPPLALRFLFPVLALLPLVFLAIAPFWPKALLLMFGLFVVNWGIKLSLRSTIDPILPALRALPAFLAVANSLQERDASELAVALERVRSNSGGFRLLRAAVRWIQVESSRENVALNAMADLAVSLQEYVNLVFLLDVNAFSFAVERIRTHQAALREVFAAIGMLDVAIAVASVREGNPGRWSRPRFVRPLRDGLGVGVTHPLLPNAVPNDFRFDGRSWLVTGSNMSGKSTFLRTVGVNSVLARTISTVFATEWNVAPNVVLTCIGRADSLVEGKSYYLAEVERVRTLLDASQRPMAHLFILDELFRGTNTVERVAAARATLEALDRGPHVVLVATHDVELLRWLAGRFAPYHFREQIAEGTLSFDHLLRAGPSSTRNAIALLRLMGYPADVVQLAEETAAEEERAKRVDQQQRDPGRE